MGLKFKMVIFQDFWIIFLKYFSIFDKYWQRTWIICIFWHFSTNLDQVKKIPHIPTVLDCWEKLGNFLYWNFFTTFDTFRRPFLILRNSVHFLKISPTVEEYLARAKESHQFWSTQTVASFQRYPDILQQYRIIIWRIWTTSRQKQRNANYCLLYLLIQTAVHFWKS